MNDANLTRRQNNLKVTQLLAKIKEQKKLELENSAKETLTSNKHLAMGE